MTRIILTPCGRVRPYPTPPRMTGRISTWLDLTRQNHSRVVLRLYWLFYNKVALHLSAVRGTVWPLPNKRVITM